MQWKGCRTAARYRDVEVVRRAKLREPIGRHDVAVSSLASDLTQHGGTRTRGSPKGEEVMVLTWDEGQRTSSKRSRTGGQSYKGLQKGKGERHQEWHPKTL